LIIFPYFFVEGYRNLQPLLLSPWIRRQSLWWAGILSKPKEQLKPWEANFLPTYILFANLKCIELFLSLSASMTIIFLALLVIFLPLMPAESQDNGTKLQASKLVQIISPQAQQNFYTGNLKNFVQVTAIVISQQN